MQPLLVDVSERTHPVAQAFERRPGLIGENADATDVRTLLGDGSERPRSRHAAEQSDEIAAAAHSITSSARSGRPPFARRDLPLWPRKAQLPLRTKYGALEACNPPTPTRGNIEVMDSGLDVGRDVVQIKLRIFIDDVRGRLVPELPVQTNLARAASGHTAAPPRSDVNSRRFMC